jgi:serine/threonine protein kinase
LTEKPGSTAYSPPEVINKLPYTTKFDVWSIGITFYELLTFNVPFLNEKAIKENDYLLPIRISAETNALITKML